MLIPDLLPCPFCLSTNVRAYYDYEECCYLVECRDCHARGPRPVVELDSTGKQEVIENWNQRKWAKAIPDDRHYATHL